jgi:HlyD family secretion protein
MRVRRKTTLILAAAVLLALLAWRTSAALRTRQAQSMNGAGRPAGVIVQTTPAALATLELRATHVGEVAAQSGVDVTPRISGVVSAIPVEEGQPVRRGQVLVRLDPKDLRFQSEMAQAGYEAARVQVEAARAALATERARLSQVLAGPPAQQVRQAEQAVRQAQAAVDFSRQQVRRQEELFSQGYVSQQQVDTARLDLTAQEARLRTAEEALALLRREPRPEAVQIARAEVAEAEVAHRQAITRLEQARVTLRQAESTLAESTVVSPIDGLVGRRLVELGQAVSPATPLVRVIDVDPAIITVAIIERDLPRIRAGLPVKVQTDALPGQTFSGRVAAISPMLSTTTRTAEVRIEIPNADRRLRPGMFTSVELLLARAENAVAVPVDAVLERPEGPTVFVIRGQTAEARRVRVGISSNGLVEITQGITAGEAVAISGHRTLRDGAQVIVPGSGGGPRGTPGGGGGAPGGAPTQPPARP